MTCLLVDAGGTNLRAAAHGPDGTLGAVRQIRVEPGTPFLRALENARDDVAPSCTASILSIAGPVQGDHVAFTNRAWAFSQTELKDHLGIDHVIAMNDFAALALGLPHLAADDVDVIAQGAPALGSPMVVLGPGTGLGVSTAVPEGDRWLSVPGEGGHVAASLDGLVPDQAQKTLWREGWLPWEEVLSGRGLVRLHAALHGTELAGPEVITALARDGHELSRRTLSTFSALLGRRASDAALQSGAWGGVFLAGGIIPKLGDLFYRAAFREAFENKGVYQDLVRRIPIKLITRPDPVFLGLSAVADQLG